MKSFVFFICEKSDSSCSECRRYNGRIYAENDRRKPKLPIHPNCRCSYKRYSGNTSNQIELLLFFKNLPEATQIVLETKYLPAGTGELIGAAKAFTVIYTDCSIWATRARNAVLKHQSSISADELLDIMDELARAGQRNDIKRIIEIYDKYK